MLKLTFLGDIFPGDELFTIGYGIKSKTNEKIIERWAKNIVGVVGNADYIIGNLESPLVNDNEAQSKIFYGRAAFAEVLKQSGVNVLNLANNHVMEHGIEGFQQTINILHSKELLSIGEEKKGIPDILTIQKNGIKMCIAGFCDERVCNIGNPGCYASLDESKVFGTLDRMKAMKPDVIAFVFHWGNEYIHFPSLEQRKFAHQIIDRGAHLIVGHHPHVIQPYEKYKDGHIIYSLGNFCFDDVQSKHFGKGMIAEINLNDRAICDVSFLGVLVQDMAYSDDLVKPMNQRDFEHDFKQISDNFQLLCHLSDEEYRSTYKTILQHEHTKERIRMRLNLAKKAIDLRHRHKSQLLKNIKNYVF